MCGIAGVFARNESGGKYFPYLHAATKSLRHRGPDASGFYADTQISLGHCRLSIIDLSEAANQPMKSADGRYMIIYNGEIFNFKTLRENLLSTGIQFQTQSDTEVLLQLYIAKGTEMLNELNGFFAFAIYDLFEKKLFLARDRFGVKPLFFYCDDSVLLFASEIKSLLEFPIARNINHQALHLYFMLNYVPAPHTMFDGIQMLQPGNCLTVTSGNVSSKVFFDLPEQVRRINPPGNYTTAQKELFSLLDDAVRLRLISDVPIGAFLSGGLDSSIICGLASRYIDKLHTFSIGFNDEEFFDETSYSQLVSKHFKTIHNEFRLSREELAASTSEILNFLDQPFADSSALPLYILSKHTRKEVTVALSGDGADELFGGYQKHIAEFRARHPHTLEKGIELLLPLLKQLPQSRQTKFSNRIRQFIRFAEGMKLNAIDRYWKWCSISTQEEVKQLLLPARLSSFKKSEEEIKLLTKAISGDKELADVFMNDVQLVLPNDMLMKVDSMSMANSLEIRTPFLDYRVALFALSLPGSWKIDGVLRKKILNDAFRNFLPPEIYHRRKQGFEIPLLSLLRKELRGLVTGNLLSPAFINEQFIFNSTVIEQLKKQMFSVNPADSAARIWALLVFQHWWQKYFLK